MNVIRPFQTRENLPAWRTGLRPAQGARIEYFRIEWIS
jgi:hypothetical protein